MIEAEVALRDIAAVNLRFALADIMIVGGRQAVIRALDHLREAESYLQILLVAMGDLATEPSSSDHTLILSSEPSPARRPE